MGDRGNIAVLQSNGTETPDQVWFYGHWSGYRMPGTLQRGLIDGKGRWTDDSYLARIIFCRLVPVKELLSETSFGISTSIGDNEYPIMVCDIPNQRVFSIKEEELKDGRVPAKFEPKEVWTFEEYCALKKLPWGDLVTA